MERRANSLAGVYRPPSAGAWAAGQRLSGDKFRALLGAIRRIVSKYRGPAPRKPL